MLFGNFQQAKDRVMKKTTRLSRILAFLFCIAVMSTGMYSLNTEADSLFSYSGMSRTLSKAGCVHRMDATDEIFGNLTGEATAAISSGARNKLSIRNLPITFFLFSAVLPFIPLLTWIIFNILLKNWFIDRMYLILFIHNSDGKKGDSAGILTA